MDHPLTTPKLTLVDRALEADGIEVKEPTRKVLAAYAPAIAKQARKEATQELHQRLGAQTLEEASQLQVVRAERDARPTEQERLAHGSHRFWQGVAVGGAVIGSVVAVGAAWYTKAVIDPAFDAAARMQMQQNVVDTMRDSVTPVTPEH